MLDNVNGFSGIKEQIIELIKEQFYIDIDLSNKNVSLESQNNGNDYILINGVKIYHFYKHNNGDLTFIKLDGDIVNWKLKDGKVTLLDENGLEYINDVSVDNRGNIKTISSTGSNSIILKEEYKVNDKVSLFRINKGNEINKYIRTINGVYIPFYINGKEAFFDTEDDRVKFAMITFKGHIDFDENGEIVTHNIDGKRCIKNEKKHNDGDKYFYTVFDIDKGEELVQETDKPMIFLFVNGEYIELEKGITNLSIYPSGSENKVSINYHGNYIRNIQLSSNGKLLRGKYNGKNAIIAENKNNDMWSNGGYYPGEYIINGLYDEGTGAYLGLKVLINGEYKDIKSELMIINPIENGLNFSLNKIDEDGEVKLYNYKGNKCKIVKAQGVGDCTLYNIASLDGQSEYKYKVLIDGEFKDITLKGEPANISSHGAASVTLTQSNQNTFRDPKINKNGEVVVHKFGNTEYLEKSPHKEFKNVKIASFLPINDSEVISKNQYETDKRYIYKIYNNGEFTDVTLNGEVVIYGYEGKNFYVEINGYKYFGVELNSNGSIVTASYLGEDVFFNSKRKGSKIERELINIENGKCIGAGVTINGNSSLLTYDSKNVTANFPYLITEVGFKDITVEIPGNIMGSRICSNIDVGDNGEIKSYEIKLDTGFGEKIYVIIGNGYFLKLGEELHRLDSSSDIITKLATILIQIKTNGILDVKIL